MKFSKFISDAASGVTGLTSASGGTAIADNKVIRGDGTTGIQGSNVNIDDSDNLIVPGALILLDGTTYQNINCASIRIASSSSGVVPITYLGTNFTAFYDASEPHVKFTRTANAENAHDAGISSPAAGVVKITNGGSGSGFLQTAGFKRKTADQTVTDSATYVADTHLTLSLAAGRSYKFRFHLFVNALTTSQIKVRLGGTATHTDLISDLRVFDYAVPGYTDANLVDSTTVTSHEVSSSALNGNAIIEINGTTTVNAAGTFLIEFAQDAETVAAETATLLRGSTLEVWDIA